MDKTLETILHLIDSDERQQVNLARYLNIPKSSISDWRSGKSCSYRKFISRICPGEDPCRIAHFRLRSRCNG